MTTKSDKPDDLKQNDAENRRPSDVGSDKGNSDNPTDLEKRRKERWFIEKFVQAEEAELSRPVKVRVGNKPERCP
jgi:hypothetical protein